MPARYAALASATALLVAALGLVAWLLRAGSLVNFISETVMTGFKTGVALHLASTQLPKLLGFKGSHGDFWERMGHVLSHLGETNPTSLALGAAALALLILGKRMLPNRPVSLLVLVGGIAAVPLLGLAGRGRGSPRRGAAGPARARPARRARLRPQPAPAPGHGVLPARGGGDGRDRADVRPQARLPARQRTRSSSRWPAATSPRASVTASR